MKRALVLIGIVLMLGGAVLGFVPQTANGVSCGSVLRGSRDPVIEDFARSLSGALSDGLSGLTPNQAACDNKRGTYKPIVWVLVIVGGAVLLGGAVTPAPKPTAPAPGEARTPQH